MLRGWREKHYGRRGNLSVESLSQYINIHYVICTLIGEVEKVGVHCFASTPSLCDAPETSRTPVGIGHLKRQLEAAIQGPH